MLSSPENSDQTSASTPSNFDSINESLDIDCLSTAYDAAPASPNPPTDFSDSPFESAEMDTNSEMVRERIIKPLVRKMLGYIFHEIRVPLHNAISNLFAVLALESIESSPFSDFPEAMDDEWSALKNSLGLITSALNKMIDCEEITPESFFSVSETRKHPYVKLRHEPRTIEESKGVATSKQSVLPDLDRITDDEKLANFINNDQLSTDAVSEHREESSTPPVTVPDRTGPVETSHSFHIPKERKSRLVDNRLRTGKRRSRSLDNSAASKLPSSSLPFALPPDKHRRHANGTYSHHENMSPGPQHRAYSSRRSLGSHSNDNGQLQRPTLGSRSTSDGLPQNYCPSRLSAITKHKASSSLSIPSFTVENFPGGSLARSNTTLSSAHRNHPQGPPPQVGKGLRVLVVDDDVLTRKLMARNLVRLGCSVDTAENGRVALESIRLLDVNVEVSVGEGRDDAIAWAKRCRCCGREPCNVELATGWIGRGSGTTSSSAESVIEIDPDKDSAIARKYDIVFLDNQMPVMSGLDTAAALRAQGNGDLIIGVTGNAMLSDQQDFLKAGADRVLVKPVFECSLVDMLLFAQQRRYQNSDEIKAL